MATGQGASLPATRTDNVAETLHGVTVVDPYRWLEDQNAPETRAWIEAQNDFTQSCLGDLPGRDALKARLAELMDIDWIGMPVQRGPRFFFFKRSAGQEQPILCLRDGLHGPDRVLIDPNAMSEDRMTSVLLLDVSQDGGLLAYGIRQGGADEFRVHFREVDSGADLPQQLPKGRYFGLSLTRDCGTVYYARHEAAGPRVYARAMNSDGQDRQIFGDGYGPEKLIGAELSEDGRYLMMTVFHGAAARKTEVYVQDLQVQGPVVTIVNDLDAQFTGSIGGDQLFLHTDWDAPNGRLFRVDLRRPERSGWLEIVPESDAVTQGFNLVGSRLFISYLKEVRSRLQVFEPDGASVGEISFPTIGSVGGMGGRWDSSNGFFSFSSFHVPTRLYHYDVQTGGQEIWAEPNVPIDTERFEVKQVWYESRDGTRVPMFVVHRRGITLDGGNPTLLTGYGGFKAMITPGFSAAAALWVERGGVYALPNLRGGGEFGEEWHQAGMQERKQNVFNDFIAAAEWLIANGYTGPDRLAISGGSNGGLLVGAALTQRPDLFRAVVCSYPLLDMVRYHQFLVAAFWVPEYGSSEDPRQFQTLHAYSPYHRVVRGVNYPAVLFITGDADTRVDPLHARKMAALMQAATGGGRPVLLRYDTQLGHSGGQPLSKQIDDSTNMLAFLLWQLGEPLNVIRDS